MIVKYTEEGWSIILQRTHGLLAAQVCGHWKKDDQPARRMETLIATAEHDDMNNELLDPDWNAATGGPVNFKMKDFDSLRCNELLNRAMSKSTYVGLLIAQHLQFLYESEKSAKEYCKHLKSNTKKWIAQAGTTDQEIAASYQLLEFCDAFSLIICEGNVQPDHRKMEISSGPGGIVYQLQTLDEGSFNVIPWPFETDSFTLIYESRTIAQLTFSDAVDFSNKLIEAPVTTHHIQVNRL